MPDMLVKLYDLPEQSPIGENLRAAGVEIRRALAPEKHILLDWVEEHFNKGWRSECDTSFSRQPISCFIAINNGRLVGFACYDVASMNIFGPTGVSETQRGLGIGKALLLRTLNAMRENGYAYAIVGGVVRAESSSPVSYGHSRSTSLPSGTRAA